MKTRLATIYSGQSKFTLHQNDEEFKIGIDHGTPLDDSYANNYINVIDISIRQDEGLVRIDFTPCTDENLLTRIKASKTKIRLQLLVHAPSMESNRQPITYPNTTWHAYVEGHIDYNSLDKQFTRAFSSGCGGYQQKSFENYKGITWVELSEQDLRNGYQTLNVSNISYKYLNATPYRGYKDAEERVSVVRMIVEMYCPALYRSGKDIFYYERNENRAISNILPFKI